MYWRMAHDPEYLPDDPGDPPIGGAETAALLFSLMRACPSFIGTSDPSLEVQHSAFYSRALSREEIRELRRSRGFRSVEDSLG